MRAFFLSQYSLVFQPARVSYWFSLWFSNMFVEGDYYQRFNCAWGVIKDSLLSQVLANNRVVAMTSGFRGFLLKLGKS